MSKPLDFFYYRKKRLHVESVDLSEVIDQVGTPAYVYSTEGLLTPFNQLQSGLSSLKNYLICYAVKSNSNLATLKLLGTAGAGADLVSGGELLRAQRAKIPAEKIVFSGVGKTADEILSGLSYGTSGIYSFHIESLEELHLIESVAKRFGRFPARVALRFNPNVDAKTHPYISTGLKKNKFGLNKEELLEAVRQARKMKFVRLCGISIHIGSQLLSLSPLRAAFESASKMALDVEAVLGHPLEFIDLGGGVGVSYRINSKAPPSLKSYTQLIIDHFGIHSVFRSRLKVLIEPGRTIAANAGILVTQVLFRKPRSTKDFLIVDAGMNDLIRPALYGSHHEVVPLKEPLKKDTLKRTDLVGPVCESSDCFRQNLYLDQNLKAGDHLAILSAGAYGMSMSSNYNSRVRPVEVLVDGKTWRVVRGREKPQDLIRGEHL